MATHQQPYRDLGYVGYYTFICLTLKNLQCLSHGAPQKDKFLTRSNVACKANWFIHAIKQ